MVKCFIYSTSDANEWNNKKGPLKFLILGIKWEQKLNLVEKSSFFKGICKHPKLRGSYQYFRDTICLIFYIKSSTQYTWNERIWPHQYLITTQVTLIVLEWSLLEESHLLFPMETTCHIQTWIHQKVSNLQLWHNW